MLNILINPSILSNLIRKGFGSKFYIKCHKLKYFCVIFHLLKCYQAQNLNLIMSLK